jgi:hypothetical protein
MSQTKRLSVVESITNTAVGFCISLVVWHWLCKWYDIPMPIKTNLEITSIFTVVSILRGYFIRRFFNAEAWKRLIGVA